VTDRTALPGRTVDLIRDGVRPADLRAGGDRAVWRALVSTAASALQRGHDFTEWAALVTETRSNLGRQMRLKGGKKERTQRTVERTLRNAWTTAEKFVAEAPAAFTRDDALAHVAVVRDWTADADSPLDDNERAVMAAACRIAERNGTTRPALPRRALVDETGLGERTVRTTLDRLHRRGLLVLEVPGRSGGDAARRKAGLYRLPDTAALETSYLYRGTRSMGPPAQIYGTPAESTTGTPAQVYGTPTDHNNSDEETAVVTVTISATDPDALAAAIDALRRNNPTVAVEPESATQRSTLSVIDGGRATRRKRPA
jgi:hypothetical protein